MLALKLDMPALFQEANVTGYLPLKCGNRLDYTREYLHRASVICVTSCRPLGAVRVLESLSE